MVVVCVYAPELCPSNLVTATHSNTQTTSRSRSGKSTGCKLACSTGAARSAPTVLNAVNGTSECKKERHRRERD